MSTNQIREKLHKYIDQANDKKVKAIYTMVEEEILPDDMWEDEAFIKELEKRVNDIESGTVKGYSWKQVEANAEKAIKSVKQR